jgi:hypothetical protein
VLRAVFRGEERIEHAFAYGRRHAGAVVLNRQPQEAAARGVISEP